MEAKKAECKQLRKQLIAKGSKLAINLCFFEKPCDEISVNDNSIRLTGIRMKNMKNKSQYSKSHLIYIFRERCQ